MALKIVDNLLTKVDKFLETKEDIDDNNQIDEPANLSSLAPDKSLLDTKKAVEFIEKSWKTDVLQTLKDYISIPNSSIDYDSEIYTNGLQEKAVNLLVNWVKSHNITGLKLEVLKDKNRTPLIFIEIPSNNNINETILMYGHFDKQPPLTEDWDKDLHPYKPVIKNGKLYGRGGADDGYSIFAAIDSIRILQEQKLDYPNIKIIIEGSEESGSKDLMYYLNKIKNRVGIPKVVICLDSGCKNYNQLWLTTSLRGILIAYIKVQLLNEGIHSGNSGIVRDSFHVLRMLLDRIDNIKTCEMIKELNVNIPESHINYAKSVAKILGDNLWKKIPLQNGVECQIPANKENAYKLLLNYSWKPQVCITGIDGIPDLKGGNVLRKYTTLKLSIRLPPTLDPEYAGKIIKQKIEQKPIPYNASIECDVGSHFGKGFVIPEYQKWLFNSLQYASKQFYGKQALFQGEGGAIPFMGKLQDMFPSAQFVITGILGPNSNAHGPNEFLNIDFTKKLICCVSRIVNDIAENCKLGNNNEKTFVLIKPDAYSKRNEIKKIIQENGFKIIKDKEIKLDKNIAEKFYIKASKLPFYNDMIKFITSDYVNILLLEKKNAVSDFVKLMGNIDPQVARKENKNSIRAVYGTDIGKNAIHGSLSIDDAVNEDKLMFG